MKREELELGADNEAPGSSCWNSWLKAISKAIHPEGLDGQYKTHPLPRLSFVNKQIERAFQVTSLRCSFFNGTSRFTRTKHLEAHSECSTDWPWLQLYLGVLLCTQNFLTSHRLYKSCLLSVLLA